MRPLLLVLLSSILASPVSAAVLAAAYPDYAQPGLSFQQHQYIAQELTLGTSVDLANVKLTFFENAGPSFSALFQIVDRIGIDATEANVLVSSTFVAPAGASPTVVEIPLTHSLNAGAYYLLISTTETLPLETRLATGSEILANATGVPGNAYFSVTQNLSLPAASPFVPYIAGGSARFVAFEIEGSVVPEPSTFYSAMVLWPGAASILAIGIRRPCSRRLRRLRG